MFLAGFSAGLNAAKTPKIDVSFRFSRHSAAMFPPPELCASGDRQASKRPELSDGERLNVAAELLSLMDRKGNLPPHAMDQVARARGCSRTTIWRLLKRVRKDGFKDITKVVSRRKGRCGRKPKYKIEKLQGRIRKINVMQRLTLRPIAGEAVDAAVNSPLQYYKEKGVIDPHTSPVKPLLTKNN